MSVPRREVSAEAKKQVSLINELSAQPVFRFATPAQVMPEGGCDRKSRGEQKVRNLAKYKRKSRSSGNLARSHCYRHPGMRRLLDRYYHGRMRVRMKSCLAHGGEPKARSSSCAQKRRSTLRDGLDGRAVGGKFM